MLLGGGRWAMITAMACVFDMQSCTSTHTQNLHALDTET